MIRREKWYKRVAAHPIAQVFVGVFLALVAARGLEWAITLI